MMSNTCTEVATTWSRRGPVVRHDPSVPRRRVDPTAVVPPTPAVYLRRRLVAAALVVVTVATVVASAVPLAGSGGVPASAAGAAPATTSVHVARSGDTMWSIAHAHRGPVSHERYLDSLIRLNGGTRIEVGQAVHLP